MKTRWSRKFSVRKRGMCPQALGAPVAASCIVSCTGEDYPLTPMPGPRIYGKLAAPLASQHLPQHPSVVPDMQVGLWHGFSSLSWHRGGPNVALSDDGLCLSLSLSLSLSFVLYFIAFIFVSLPRSVSQVSSLLLHCTRVASWFKSFTRREHELSHIAFWLRKHPWGWAGHSSEGHVSHS